MYFNLNIDLFNIESWSTYLITFAVCLLLGLLLQWFLFILLKILQGKRPTVLKEQLIKQLRLPTKFFLPVLFMYSSLQYFDASTFWHKLVEAFIIINIAWILISLMNALEEVIKERFSVSGVYKARDRKVLTQLRFIKSISFVVIITLAVAAILWNIPGVKKIGTTILTSAGVIGIIVGVAAQKSIANLITGFQIAFTQPIKIDDEVVIEGEFGTVEDITLTYVIIKLWDWRRLVLPLSYFNDNSFVNWSFKTKEIIGTVFFYVDYIFPVPEIRTKLYEVLEENELWDHKEVNLLVTNIDARTMELRATFSARNASDIWNLRCYVRENLINYIQQFYKDSLPKYRKMEI